MKNFFRGLGPRRFLLALVSMQLLGFVFAVEAQADRRSSLMGNLLVRDTDDVFFFPQLATQHVRLVTFDLAVAGAADANQAPQNAATSGLGSAGLIFGSPDFAVGIFSHRGDTFSSLPAAYFLAGDIDLQFGAPAGCGAPGGCALGPTYLFPFPSTNPVFLDRLIPPMQWIDALAGFKLGSIPMGVRLSVGHGRNNTDIDDDGDMRTEDHTATAINAVAGLSLEGPKLDLALEFSRGSQAFLLDDEFADQLDTIDVGSSNLALLGRGFFTMAEDMELGYTALFYYRGARAKIDLESTDMDDEVNLSTVGFDVAAGPVFHVDKKFTVAAMAGIGVQSESIELSTDDDLDPGSRFTFGIPMMKLSGEFAAFEWLTLRAGAQYLYFFKTTNDQPDEDINRSNTAAGSGFRWISGVGIQQSGIELNGTFNAPFLLDGPDLIGGKGSGLFALLNLMYRF